MATIREREGKDGVITYNVMIRKKGVDICKTFLKLDDAKIYVFYKERLIQNMENFSVPIKDRITIEQVYEMKIKSLPDNSDFRTKLNFTSSMERISEYIKKDKFLVEYTYEDWLECCKKLAEMFVYRGARKEKNKRKISIKTLRNIFSYASSAMSYAQSMAIPIDNHAMKIVKSYISTLKD